MRITLREKAISLARLAKQKIITENEAANQLQQFSNDGLTFIAALALIQNPREWDKLT